MAFARRIQNPEGLYFMLLLPPSSGGVARAIRFKALRDGSPLQYMYFHPF